MINCESFANDGMEMVNSKPVDHFEIKETEQHQQQQQLPHENGDNESRNTNKYTYTFSTQPLKTDLKKLLRQVTGETELLNVIEVKLKVVSGQAGLHRLSDYTPNLTKLTLDGSCVSSFRDLGSDLKCLMTLSVARCNMKHLDGVWGFRSLRELNARENFVSDPSPCSGVRELTKLDLGDNQIVDISYFAFLRSCKRLEELRIAGNKFSSEYRREIMKFIPQLRILDGEELEDCLPRSDADKEEEGYIMNDGNQSSEDGSTASLLIDEIDLEQQMEIREKEGEEKEEDRDEKQKACNQKSGSVGPRDDRTDSGSTDTTEVPFDVRNHPDSPTEDSKGALTNADRITTQEIPPPATCRLSYGRVICGNLAISLLTRNPTKSNSGSFAAPQAVEKEPKLESNDGENHEERESELNSKR